MKKYRIGLVGFAHMHVLDQIKPFLNILKAPAAP